MASIQDWIHTLEEGAGKKVILGFVAVVVLIGLVVAYDTRLAQNFSNAEAMDAAQLARNIARGEGYVTQNVRPLSMAVLRDHQLKNGAGTNVVGADLTKIRGAKDHPDLENAPMYPLLLAGFMRFTDLLDTVAKSKLVQKVTGRIGIQLELNAHGFRIPEEGVTLRFPPDFMVHLFNQFLFLIATVMVWWLGSRLFEPMVGMIAAAAFIGSEMFWRFATSGLPTTLMMVLFLGTAMTLSLLERKQREGSLSWVNCILLAILAGLLLGAGALTRYSFGVLIIPAAVFTGWFCAGRRLVITGLMVVVFLAVLTPWIVRNMKVCGLPFGTATYAVTVNAGASGPKLERSLNTKEALKDFGFHGVRNKLTSGFAEILQNDIPRLGGSWLSAFFLVGLLIRFRNPGLSRLRILALGSLLMLIMAQALARTHVSEQATGITSENLLVIVAPLIFVFGTAMFFVLLDQWRMPFPQARLVFSVLFAVILSLPLALSLIRTRSWPVAYPPYNPSLIQKIAAWMEPNEAIMSDVPAAVAWYANRQCIGFTLDLEKDFFTINDYQKPVKALYLTQVTLDGRFQSEFVGSDTRLWGLLFLQSLIQRDVPARFPLRAVLPGFFPNTMAGQLLMMDRERWRKAGPE